MAILTIEDLENQRAEEYLNSLFRTRVQLGSELPKKWMNRIRLALVESVEGFVPTNPEPWDPESDHEKFDSYLILFRIFSIPKFRLDYENIEYRQYLQRIIKIFVDEDEDIPLYSLV